jgi:hypothetical protein
LHGWVYDLHDGLLKSLEIRGPDDPLEEIYRYAFDDG